VTARIIDGKAVAQATEQEVASSISRLRFRPGLVAVRVGNDPASEIYVRNKAKKARELGLAGTELVFPDSMTEAELLDEVHRLNADDSVDGILVQLPLPKQIDARAVIEAIAPEKDVDGFHYQNVGSLIVGGCAFYPCTPWGVMKMLEHEGVPVEGAHAVVVGRSTIVGKPMALMLLNAGATVTVCHSKTRDLAAMTRQADILVAAVGKPRMITASMVKAGATVIDVGINRLPDGTLAGDVDFESVRQVAARITPVPGGVGPMTIAMLLGNTVKSAERRIP
jgi:methylenetetrahydrofolate dehydrogenase (NADP+)/methenyltetrahydrofolate cyclohydrolase